MSNAETALNFLKSDIQKARDQWETGKQFESLLQRNDISFDELIEMFNPKESEDAWLEEYSGKGRTVQLLRHRKRLEFLESSKKEFYEEYDDNVSDVDFMRLLEVPFTDSKYPIDYSLYEFKENK